MGFWRRKRHDDDDYPYPIETMAEQSSNPELLAAENEVNVREDLKTEHIADMTIHYVNSMEEVIELALENSPATRE